MKAQILSEIFSELCESQTHFDSLLFKVAPHQKFKVATLLGAFLRRPLTIASHFGISLASDAEEFWNLSFIKLKKNPQVHQCFNELWEKWDSAPNEGSIQDFSPRFIETLTSDWGEDKAKAMARFLSQDPLTTIRLHRRAFDASGALVPEIEAWLKTEGLPKSRPGNFAPHARVFRGFARVQQNEFFEKGYFEIQDEGSQVMSLFTLYPELMMKSLKDAPQTEKQMRDAFPSFPDLGAMTVIDACSGAGGKTLALADAMKGKGRLYAYDIYDRKIKNLKQRAERAQERNIQGLLIPKDDRSALKKFEGTADVVLIDAPCSGYGVLRRNPDSKWNRKPMDQARRDAELPLPELQAQILDYYSPLVKSGGRLVYGVCTVIKEESLKPVEAFLSTQSEFVLHAEGFVGPYDTDGFFMASLKKK